MAGFADVPPPVQYAPRENLGLQLVQGAGQVLGAMKQGQAYQSNQEFQTAFGQAYANKDYNAMQQLAAQHPQQWQQVQQGMTAIQQGNREALGAASSDLSLAAASGNPQAVMNVAARHSGVLQGLGVSPEGLATAYQQNPQQVRQYADMLGTHALGPEQYFGMQNKTLERLQQGQYQQGRLALGQQQLQQQTANQNAQLAQGQQRLGLDAQMNQIKTQDLQLQRQMQKGKMDQDWQAKQQASLAAKQQLVDAFDNGSNNLSNMLTTLNDVQQLDPKTFDGMWGISGAVNRRIPGSPEQAAWSSIEQMQGQARLMGVIGMKGTGPVSDAEGQAAARAYLSLTPTTPATAARKAINNWNTVLQRQAKYQETRQPQIDIYKQQILQNQERQAQQLQGGQQPGVSPAGGNTGGAVDWNTLN